MKRTYKPKVQASPNSRARSIPCEKCGRSRFPDEDCVTCAAIREWEKLHKRAWPGTASEDRMGRETRQLNVMVGVSN